MAFIKEENADFRIEEVFTLKYEETEEQTEVSHRGSEVDLDADNSRSDVEGDAPPRKRQRAKITCKRVINQQKRMAGESYIGKQKQKDIIKEPRAMGPRCSSAACVKSAKHHCSAISEPERKHIFNDFWQHMTWEEKRMYVHELIDVVPVQRRRRNASTRRSNSMLFFLLVSGQRRRVCKRMFLSTLGISEWFAHSWAKKRHTQADTEGQAHSNTHHSVTSHAFICRFLQDLPTVPSHYCRSTTSKQYLEPVFQSMTDLYAVYCRAAAEKTVTPLSRQVFTEEFKRLNLGLYHTMKDQCNICCAFKSGNMPDDKWQHHLLKREEEDTVVHADFSGGLKGEEASQLAPDQVQTDTEVSHRGSEEDLDADNSCSDVEDDTLPRKRRRAKITCNRVLERLTRKREINREKRMAGESYVGKQKQKNIMRKPRAMGPGCSSAACAKSAKHHCSAISEPERKHIFNDFWQHMTWEEKRVYVNGLIDVVPVQRRRGTENSRRSNSMLFFLRVSGQRRRVCRRMFLSTLGIGEWSAHSWAKKGHTQADTEGQTHSNAQSSVAGHEFICNFLQDLPTVPSHYCRSTTSKQYLEPVFQSMTDLYAVYCRAAAEKTVTPLPRQVFTEEFNRLNLDLYHTMKDQCHICCAFKSGNLPDDEWQHHLLKTEEARAEKLSDKSKASNKIMVICMDLQAPLLCPKLNASAVYYKTKLAVHNFTIYNVLTHSATCYVWHEGEGSLSASEFASCVVDYLSAHTEPDTVILWSDGCGDQYRNAVLSNALLLFSMKKNKVVIQKYLEKGHPEIECDSVHSVIERRLRDEDVYLPAEYVNLMKRAHVKPHPYEVKYVDHTFFQDFTKLRLCKSLHPGVKSGYLTEHDVRAIRYNNIGTMDFKINLSDDWHPYPSRKLRNSRSGTHTVTRLYSEQPKIKELTFRHLQELKEVIPKDFHSFYDNLLH